MGAHSEATRADRWSGDGTAQALEWFTLGELDGTDKREEVKDLDRVGNGFHSIAREISELAYSWDSKGNGKTEFAGIVDNVE